MEIDWKIKSRFFDWRKPCMNKECGKPFKLFDSTFNISRPSKGFATLCENCCKKFVDRGMND